MEYAVWGNIICVFMAIGIPSALLLWGGWALYIVVQRLLERRRPSASTQQ